MGRFTNYGFITYTQSQDDKVYINRKIKILIPRNPHLFWADFRVVSSSMAFMRGRSWQRYMYCDDSASWWRRS